MNKYLCRSIGGLLIASACIGGYTFSQLRHSGATEMDAPSINYPCSGICTLTADAASQLATSGSSEVSDVIPVAIPQEVTQDLHVISLYGANCRQEPTTDSIVLKELHYRDVISVTYVEGAEWGSCIIDDTVGYVWLGNFATEPPAAYEYYGPVLTPSSGKVYGPSGRETFYNLNMTHIVSRMSALGYEYDYWVRDDGVKMYGPFVMVAANLRTRPLGTIVPTSLGEGIVVDTGSFVASEPNGLDVAVCW